MSVEDFKIAHLSHEDMMKIEQLENELGLTLIAYDNLDEKQNPNPNETPHS